MILPVFHTECNKFKRIREIGIAEIMYRNMFAGLGIVLHTAYISLHIDVENATFLLCAPNFDLKVGWVVIMELRHLVEQRQFH